jgi:hypothetical protein
MVREGRDRERGLVAERLADVPPADDSVDVSEGEISGDDE